MTKNRIALEAPRSPADVIPRRLRTICELYNAQNDHLRRLHVRNEDPVFVASCGVFYHPEAEQFRSICVWTRGVDTLLPETDIISFVQFDSSGTTAMVTASNWTTVQKVVGDLMEPQQLRPERWRVRTFPEQAMLDQIGDLLEDWSSRRS